VSNQAGQDDVPIASPASNHSDQINESITYGLPERYIWEILKYSILILTSVYHRSQSSVPSTQLHLASPPPSVSATEPILQDQWGLLPPMDELIEGVKVFSTYCFQLGK
jgi:hypothetical protein